MAVEFHRTGILVMSHGTPASLEDLAEFYTKIRRGSPPPLDLLDELRSRYEAIGGVSPLGDITASQARNLAIGLGGIVPMAVGTKFSSPSIEQALDGLLARQVNQVACIVMTPQEPTPDYFERVVAHTGVTLRFLRSWYTNEAFISYHVNQIKEHLSKDPECLVIFTAHSLPVFVGEKYREQVAETARLIADRLGDLNWVQVFQSAGRTNDEWLGPDIRDLLRETSHKSVLVVPVGFASDNLETLYDLDIEARAIAREVGVVFERTRPPNGDMATMASLAQDLLGIISSEGHVNFN